MIEYPSIPHASKAPRARCIAFSKMDGSNIRIKYTRKRGFCEYGSRTQRLEPSHPILGGAITYFMENLAEKVERVIVDNWPNEREVMVFGEWFGPSSFAGWHVIEEAKKMVVFDIMVSHKNRKFVLPQEFIKLFDGQIEIPRVVYEGNLNDQLITDVKENKYNLNEGVICKGCEKTGAARGGVWMAKIKTNAYFERLKAKFGEDEFKKYW